MRCGLVTAPQQRNYAEAALAVKEPDWDTLSTLVTSDEAKRELASLRGQFGELRSKLTSQTHVRTPLYDSFLVGMCCQGRHCSALQETLP